MRTWDEYGTRDQPVTKSFYDRCGFDGREGPPKEDAEENEDNAQWGKSDPRLW